MGILRFPSAEWALRTYLLPVIAVSAATAARAGLMLWLDTGSFTFGLFYLAIAISAWFGGFRSGLAALVLSAIGCDLLLAPTGSLYIGSSADLVEWSLFLAVALSITLIIDARNKQRERAEHAEATLRQLIDVAPVGILLFDKDMRFRLVNKALADMNGIPIAQHIGRSVGEVLPVFEAVARERFQEVMRTGRNLPPFELAGTTPAKPGQKRVWLETWFPIKDTLGEVLGVGAMVEDITDRRTEEENAQALSQQKSEFLAVLGHELRTPLGALTAALEVLLYKERDPAFLQAVTVAKRQVNHIKRLAEDLFDVSRATSRRLELELKPVDLRAILSDVMDAVRPKCAAKQQTLDLRLGASVCTTVIGDSERLTQVFSNLLQNAAKFTPENGHIDVTVSAADHQVEITVSDTGMGIPSDSLSTIFDMWAQGKTTERGAGLGIGLALAKEIVGLHGGRIAASSQGLGKGAQFWVWLPLSSAGVTAE